MQSNLIKCASIFTVLITIVTMIGMISYAMERELIYIDDNSVEEDIVSGIAANDLLESKRELIIVKNEEALEDLVIPLDTSIQQSNIQIQNNYVNRQLVFKFEGEHSAFYQEAVIHDRQDYIDRAYYCTSGENTYLMIQVNDLYEYVITYKNNTMLMQFYRPSEIYDKIIVIDPAYGGEEIGSSIDGIQEKDVVLHVSLAIKERMAHSDYKVYYTRTDEEYVSDELRLRLINDSKADMVIRIELDEQEDSSIYGARAIYNDAYFIPRFDGIMLSDCILRSVAMYSGTQARGLQQGDTTLDSVVVGARVPITTIQLGCLSNALERSLLHDNAYQIQLAKGIIAGIEEAYDVIEEIE